MGCVAVIWVDAQYFSVCRELVPDSCVQYPAQENCRHRYSISSTKIFGSVSKTVATTHLII